MKRVFDDNLGQFLQTERLASSSGRRDSFRDQYVDRVGILVADEQLDIGERQNEWLVHELDLRRLVRPAANDLFVLSLSFEREDMIWELTSRPRFYSGDDYYSHPNSWG